ncbi:TIGR01741 family protein [Staphylococcus aureus]
MFKKLRNAFKEEDLEPWTSCEFDFTRDGQKSMLYLIMLIGSEFGPIAKRNYYMYKKFGVLPETEYEINKVKEIDPIC